MLDVNLGTLPDWLAAAGTVGAFWVTYLLLRKEQKARREFEDENRQAQARLVSAWITFPRQAGPHSAVHVADLVVKNMSEEPVYDLRATLIPHSKLPEDDPEGAMGPDVIRFHFGIMPPEERGTTRIKDVPSEPLAVILAFTDAHGREWRRFHNGDLTGPTLPPPGAPDPVLLWSTRQLRGLAEEE
jgi:hypothetical protein